MIMKNQYVKPEMQVEEFSANDYVGACGDSGKVYKFTCNAGTAPYITGSWLNRKTYDYPYCIMNSSGQYLKNKSNWTFTSSTKTDDHIHYAPCNETHEATSMDGVFVTGCYIDNDYSDSDTPIAVTIWRGNNKNNVHCTTNLDITSWETAKS